MNVSRINSAAEYINVNYYKNITMQDLCRLTGYSESHLRRLFVKNFGMSPQNYIVEKRMEMAKEMLLDIPEKTVDEIADLLGISSTSYFCKLFRSKNGMSPSDYKRLNVKN
jgi:two-component system response regulator YesN